MNYSNQLNYHLNMMKKISEGMIAKSKENFKIEMLMNSIENDVSVIISIYEEKLKAKKDEVKTPKAYPIQILQLREEYGYFDTESVIINPLPTGPAGKPETALWTSSYVLEGDPKKLFDERRYRTVEITDWEDFAREEIIESYNGNLYEVMPIDDALILDIDNDEMNIIKLDGTITVPFSELMSDKLLFADLFIDKFVMDFHYLRKKYKVDIVHATFDAVHGDSGIYYGQGIYNYMRFLDTTITCWDAESSFWLNPDAIKEVKYLGKVDD